MTETPKQSATIEKFNEMIEVRDNKIDQLEEELDSLKKTQKKEQMEIWETYMRIFGQEGNLEELVSAKLKSLEDEISTLKSSL